LLMRIIHYIWHCCQYATLNLEECRARIDIAYRLIGLRPCRREVARATG